VPATGKELPVEADQTISQPQGAQTTPALVPPPRPTNIFQGPHGLRSGWRLVLYFAILFALSFLLGKLIRQFVHHPQGSPTAASMLLQETISFALVFGVAVVMSQIEGRPIGAYGLPGREAFGRKFWLGFLFGILEISLLMGLIAAFGGYSFGPLALAGSDVFRWGLILLVLFIFVGFFEEFLFRGYTQFTLGDGIGFWPAAIVLSVLFGAVHLSNPGEGPVGAASVVLVGLFFCFSLYRTGSLWYAVGLHASFDWGESYLYSVPDSGLVLQGHLSNSLLHGPKWLTGGSVGPEGSVFCFLTMGLQFLVVALLFPKRKIQPGPSADPVRIGS
jgi:membrane protease YdiL (CAAX protease family)